MHVDRGRFSYLLVGCDPSVRVAVRPTGGCTCVSSRRSRLLRYFSAEHWWLVDPRNPVRGSSERHGSNGCHSVFCQQTERQVPPSRVQLDPYFLLSSRGEEKILMNATCVRPENVQLSTCCNCSKETGFERRRVKWSKLSQLYGTVETSGQPCRKESKFCTQNTFVHHATLYTLGVVNENRFNH